MDMAKPTIRFKGYQDDWEQRKLGDIGKARSGVGFPDAEHRRGNRYTVASKFPI